MVTHLRSIVLPVLPGLSPAKLSCDRATIRSGFRRALESPDGGRFGVSGVPSCQHDRFLRAEHCLARELARARPKLAAGGLNVSSFDPGSLRLLRLAWRGGIRLADRKQDGAHDMLGYAAVAKLIQLKGVLSSIGSLLGQVPDGLGPEHERDRIRAGYCLKGGYQPVVARITRKARRVLRID